MTTQVKINGKTRKVKGTQKSKVDGSPLTEDMFFDKNENLNEIKEVLMWCNGWAFPKNNGAWSDLYTERKTHSSFLRGWDVSDH